MDVINVLPDPVALVNKGKYLPCEAEQAKGRWKRFLHGRKVIYWRGKKFVIRKFRIGKMMHWPGGSGKTTLFELTKDKTNG